jgi:hypothetical protein
MLLMGLGSIEGLDLWMVTDVVLVLRCGIDDWSLNGI